MVHRDALLAAQERILALERELDGLRAREGESVPATVQRLEKEKRALEAERTRLRVERERLVSDLAQVKAALARAEEEAARARREAKEALAVRDELRKQAIAEAARAGALRRRAASEVPPAPRKRTSRKQRRVDERAEGAPPTEERVSVSPRARARSELVALDAHNRALPAATDQPGAGVLCPTCLARGERVEMILLGLGLPAADAALTACPRCGATGLKRAR